MDIKKHGKVDPYQVDAGAGEAADKSGPQHFAVAVVNNVNVITLLESNVLDAHVINEMGDGIVEYLNAAPTPRTVISLTNVQHLSSSALGMLIRCKATAEQRGGKLALANVRDSLKQIFAITKLDKVLPMHATTDAAIGVM